MYPNAEIESSPVHDQRAFLEKRSPLGVVQVGKTDKVVGKIAHEGFRDVANQFQEVVVRSQVGVVDVAWALKDLKTKEVTKVLNQQARDLRVLDNEYKEVLKK